MGMRAGWLPAVAMAAALFALATPAHSQVRVPSISVPTAPLPTVVRDAGTLATGTVGAVVADARRLTIERLLKDNHAVLDRDPRGNPIVRDELVALLSADRAGAVAWPAGVRVLRRAPVASLDLELLVLSVPPGRSIHRLLKELRRSDAATVFDYNHLYLEVGTETTPSSAPAARAPAVADLTSAVVGMIDAGVDVTHASLHGATVVSWGCETPVPAAHGTAVASLIAGTDGAFHGAAPRARVFAADVFCGRPTGGAVDALAGAFGWLLERAVPVVNVSLVGPRNLALEMLVVHAQSAGQIVVAAVGNDGPAAPPLYPAAYRGVIGVTGVDSKRRVLLEANQGPQVSFAAPGADMVAAKVGGGYVEVRGTSFAAPIVAALLAERRTDVEAGCATCPVDLLAKQAIPIGGRSRGPVFGYGVVGEGARTAPERK